jgi:hypothetical protein
MHETVTTRTLPAALHARRVSWGAVAAGLACTIAFQILFAELAAGVGLAVYEPLDPSSSVVRVTMGTMAVWTTGALLSIFLGGWVAGRMKRIGSRTEAALHGTLVWATGAVAGIVLAGVSLGLLAGGTVSLLGDGLTAAGNVAGGAGPAVAQAIAPNWDEIKQQVQDATTRMDDAASAAQGATGGADNRFADRSRMMQLLGEEFSTDPGHVAPQANRTELTGLLASQLGISQAAADNTLTQWDNSWKASMARYEELKQEALEAATIAKQRAAQAAFVACLLMLVGLGSAILGGIAGARSGSAVRELVVEDSVLAPTPRVAVT